MLFGIPQGENANLLILGISWDVSSSYRRGAAEAPSYIRKATSEALYNSFTENLVNLSEIWRYRDLGDLTPSSFKELKNEVLHVVRENFENQVFLFLGGDHSITYATVKAIREVTGKKFGLVYFDAHPDLYAEYDGDLYSHACPVRRIVEDGLIPGDWVLQIGIRAPTPQQIEFADEHGITIIPAREIHRLSEVDVPFDTAYFSFDMDVLDPAFAPGVGNPEPGGLSVRELIDSIHTLSTKILAFDIVELNPRYDVSGITGFAAAKIIREMLGLASLTLKTFK